MFLQIKKLKAIIDFVRDLNIIKDDETNSYVVSSKRNLIIQSEKSIVINSKDSIILLGRKVHFNPKLYDSFIKEYKEVSKNKHLKIPLQKYKWSTTPK